MFASDSNTKATLGDVMQVHLLAPSITSYALSYAPPLRAHVLPQLNSVFSNVFESLSLPASSWTDVQEFRSVFRRYQRAHSLGCRALSRGPITMPA